MTRGEKPASRRASDGAADPLDEALRQIGADMLDEPVPERLLQILRQAQGRSEPGPEVPNRRRSQGNEPR